MAVQIHPPGRYGIENLEAVLSLKKHAFATPNPERRRIGAFLRERVPQMQVGCDHGLWKRLPVEIIRESFQQRRAVEFFAPIRTTPWTFNCAPRSAASVSRV